MGENANRGLIAGITTFFLKGPTSLLLIILAFLLGGIAIYSTPREEEPQIVVPTADISVSFPGHSAEEVEQLVTLPLEKLIWQIDGVEHVYSISRRDNSFVTVRFFVGEDRERSIIKLRDKIESNKDIVPPGVRDWIIKPVEIDDVPIVTITFFSDSLGGYALRRIAEEFKVNLEKLENISKTEVIGGQKRVIRVEPDIEKAASMRISFNDIINSLQYNNLASSAGKMTLQGRNNNLVLNSLLENADDIKGTIITADSFPDIRLNDIAWLYSTMYGKSEDKTVDRIVRIEDIAAVTDADEEPDNYLSMGFGPASEYYEQFKNKRLNAVTLSFSKKKGTNAVSVAEKIIKEVNSLKNTLPSDVNLAVTRNYGEIANDKVNGLIESMIFAIITVIALIYFTMGWREGLVVGLAVPVSFALALFVNYISGYTINRVTLFALILSLGLVVDDPITNVDNIQRHIRMGRENAFNATISAVREVLPPVIMSTLTIIISFIPMFFITGMMGPYMAPMAINVPMAVTFSTLCALTFVPWLSYMLLRGHSTYSGNSFPRFAKIDAEEKPLNNNDVTPGWIRKIYRSIITPFLNKKVGISLLILMFVVTLGTALLLLLKVPLKMLPYDNKDELQLIVNLPEGSTLEETDRFTHELTQYLASVNEVKDFQAYTGVNSPVDFNGLVRRYNFRRQQHQADIRINLASKYSRSSQSHTIGLRLRRDITDIADKHNAKVKIVEVPPGPPVISTIAAEIRGGNEQDYSDLINAADTLKSVMKESDPIHITEIDDMSEQPHSRVVFDVDSEKLASSYLSASDVYNELSAALGGAVAGLSHTQKERNPLLINVRLPYSERNDLERLSQLWIKNRKGEMIQLAELGTFAEQDEDQPIYHKDLERVVYVTAESAGKAPGEIILGIMSSLKSNPLPDNISVNWAGEGEWEITLRVFRDLGIAFGIALIGIYLLLTLQMKHFFMPLIVMMAIPLTIIGIAPGFYLLNLVAGGNAGGYPDPLFFTATAMIGMIALGGIVTRNSIVLIEFIQESIASGNSLCEAVIESGSVRFRPIILTALTTMLGAWPITFDPVFSGLAWSLIFGLISSTIFTMIVIPVVYFLIKNRKLSNIKLEE